MDIQSSVLDELFALFPVIIQGWVSPVKPIGTADGGIPKSLYDDQPRGLECLVDPWTELQSRSLTMAADDRVDLYLNDEINPVTGHSVSAGDEQLRIRLYVPHARLRHGVNRMHYKVKRASGNVSEDSRDVHILYHLRLADGLNLLIPPRFIKDGVSADDAQKGVEFGFDYNNRRSYDRIELLVGDAHVSFDVPDAPAPITKTLFADTFEQAGDNPKSVVEFKVFDQLGNVVASSPQYLDIHLDEQVKPIVEDFESIPTQVITPGGTINTPSFDIFYASGEASSQVAVAPANGANQGEIKGQSLHSSYYAEAPYTSTVQIELRLKIVCSRVSFFSGSVSAPASVSFYNASGALLGARAIPHIAQGSIYYLTDFSASGISKVTLSPTGRDWCAFDMFTFWP